MRQQHQQQQLRQQQQQLQQEHQLLQGEGQSAVQGAGKGDTGEEEAKEDSDQAASDAQHPQPQQPLCLVAQAPEQCAVGWVFHRDDVFDGGLLLQLLQALVALSCVIRAKGVFR